MAIAAKSSKDVMDAISKEDIKVVDIKFTDLYGQWQHFSLPIEGFSEDVFEEGLGFDGSSIRGFKTIESSDMVLLPDPTTAFVDPATAVPTMSLICDVVEPITYEKFSRDPRQVAKKAIEYLQSTGIADQAYVGPEAEFFIFDSVSYETGRYFSSYAVDSEEAPWRSGITGQGHQIGWKGGYFPVSPYDTLQDIRTEMVSAMIEAGIDVEVHHHEVATAGQCEIDMKFSPLVKMADQVQLYKYIVKNVAKKNGKTATFMPKPLFEDNGSGMHTHISLWKGSTPLFAGDQYAGLSQTALWFIGGILTHINSLLAFCAPTTNSYRRLVPGYEAPVNIAYSARNRSAACRIPVYSQSPKAKRVEFRCPDPSANPYLAFSAILLAGLDGIAKQIDPGDPAETDLFEHGHASRPTVKGSLGEILDALEADNEYLTAGDVFTPDLIETYIATKRLADVDAIRLRPHPQEFVLYYGI